MDIPYGFDCYAFKQNEVKFYEPNIVKASSLGVLPHDGSFSSKKAQLGYVDQQSGKRYEGFIRFTRKNEDYSNEQLRALTQAGRLGVDELNKQIFCGIKIQIGVGVVTNFLHKGIQYKRPNKGRSELINGTWNGIVSGLTVDVDAPNSYDVAFGNFLAYDEEFPYIKFGPFFAIESKLVMLTGSSRSIEASSFGTNIRSEIWFIILFLILILSVLASFRVHWQQTKQHTFEAQIRHLLSKVDSSTGKSIKKGFKPSLSDELLIEPNSEEFGGLNERSITRMIHNFFFIYFTMLLNKPSLEFDDFIWPKHNPLISKKDAIIKHHVNRLADKKIEKILGDNESLRKHHDKLVKGKRKRKHLPTSVRILSYLWSAACLVMASIYSGEMLAVILLHADQNIDTISQLINSKPPIEPVIRQDDFTYNLMLKSLDENMLVLHSKTKIISRLEVYTPRFIQGVSERKQALLGDDELIETIYDTYHKSFPLYRSKMTYLQFPISIMYRKDLNATLERGLRRGMMQAFEMGLIQRWYQAQKEAYMQFYDSYEKKDDQTPSNNQQAGNSDQKYKPLSMHHFESFFRLVTYCIGFAVLVLCFEVLHDHMFNTAVVVPACGVYNS